MKIKKKELRRLIENFLLEVAIDTVYKYENGVYSHVDGEEQDPYTYKVVGGNKGTDILVKIVSKKAGAKGSVGAKFKITAEKVNKNNNVQKLHNAIANFQPEYRLPVGTKEDVIDDKKVAIGTSKGLSADFEVFENMQQVIDGAKKVWQGIPEPKTLIGEISRPFSLVELARELGLDMRKAASLPSGHGRDRDMGGTIDDVVKFIGGKPSFVGFYKESDGAIRLTVINKLPGDKFAAMSNEYCTYLAYSQAPRQQNNS